MKILRTIIPALLAMLSFSSCDKWLEATSDMDLPADKLFETRGGFRDAMSGIYITMGDFNAYGGAYTWHVNELTGFPNASTTDALMSSFQKHNYSYKSVKSQLLSMWYQGYKIIANINVMLRELESRRDVVTSEVEYNLFKGELLALRAYVHFDLMRMYGLGNWDGENASKLTIPYVTVYDKEPVAQKSYSQTAELLLEDINAALACLEETDPVTGVVTENFETAVNDDGFWNNRISHLNYYGVKALAARVYQWMNDTETAAQYAQDVIDGTLGTGLLSWVDVENLLLTTSNDGRDWSFTTEHVFSLTVPELYKSINSYVFGTAVSGVINVNTSLVEKVLFPIVDENGSVSGAEDIRGTAVHLHYSGVGYANYKLYGSSTFYYDYRNKLPMVKVSEMFYILAENYIAKGEAALALEALNTVRRNRGISDSLPEDSDLEAELMKEYYREFIGEGKLFYWLKHKNVSESLISEFAVTAADLIYPYPDDEINYGRVQEL